MAERIVAFAIVVGVLLFIASIASDDPDPPWARGADEVGSPFEAPRAQSPPAEPLAREAPGGDAPGTTASIGGPDDRDDEDDDGPPKDKGGPRGKAKGKARKD